MLAKDSDDDYLKVLAETAAKAAGRNTFLVKPFEKQSEGKLIFLLNK